MLASRLFVLPVLLSLAACAASGDPEPGSSAPSADPIGTETRGAETILRATGNEPFWQLQIDADSLRFDMLGGDVDLEVTTPQPSAVGGGLNWRVSEGGSTLSATLLERLCKDTMTGMPHPQTVVVFLDGEYLQGCGGEPASLLAGGEWVVERLNVNTLRGEERPTLRFDIDEQRLTGSTACNRYMASYTLTREGLSVGHAASTRRACEQTVMELEQEFLELLAGVYRFSMDNELRLYLHAPGDQYLIARQQDTD
jgi:heat shock protein HslJ